MGEHRHSSKAALSSTFTGGKNPLELVEDGGYNLDFTKAKKNTNNINSMNGSRYNPHYPALKLFDSLVMFGCGMYAGVAVLRLALLALLQQYPVVSTVFEWTEPVLSRVEFICCALGALLALNFLCKSVQFMQDTYGNGVDAPDARQASAFTINLENGGSHSISSTIAPVAEEEFSNLARNNHAAVNRDGVSDERSHHNFSRSRSVSGMMVGVAMVLYLLACGFISAASCVESLLFRRANIGSTYLLDKHTEAKHFWLVTLWIRFICGVLGWVMLGIYISSQTRSRRSSSVEYIYQPTPLTAENNDDAFLMLKALTAAATQRDRYRQPGNYGLSVDSHLEGDDLMGRENIEGTRTITDRLDHTRQVNSTLRSLRNGEDQLPKEQQDDYDEGGFERSGVAMGSLIRHREGVHQQQTDTARNGYGPALVGSPLDPRKGRSPDQQYDIGTKLTKKRGRALDNGVDSLSAREELRARAEKQRRQAEMMNGNDSSAHSAIPNHRELAEMGRVDRNAMKNTVEMLKEQIQHEQTKNVSYLYSPQRMNATHGVNDEFGNTNQSNNYNSLYSQQQQQQQQQQQNWSAAHYNNPAITTHPHSINEHSRTMTYGESVMNNNTNPSTFNNEYNGNGRKVQFQGNNQNYY